MSTPVRIFDLSSETILSRQTSHFSHQNSEMTPLQNQVDYLVTGFLDQATDVNTLAALTAGGLAYRFGKIGVMGMGSSVVHRPWAVVVGL